MSKRHRKNTRVTSLPGRPSRKLENLRVPLDALRRGLDVRARRQFVPYDLPPSKVRFSDDFRQRTPETYTLVDGRPATVRPELPRNVNHGDLYESDLQTAVHDYFQEPSEHVSLCERRARRRRVLFALRKTGKGAHSKRRNWTEESKVRCV